MQSKLKNMERVSISKTDELKTACALAHELEAQIESLNRQLTAEKQLHELDEALNRAKADKAPVLNETTVSLK